MMSQLNSKLEQCVEALCQHGCESVSARIKALRAGQVFAEVADLNVAERRMLLDELESIMAPYEGEGKG
jgi:hypothetical protein